MAENSDTQSSTTQISTENPTGQVTKKSSILYSEAITVKEDVIDEIALSSGLVRDGNTSHVYSVEYAFLLSHFTNTLPQVPSFHGFPCSADGNIKMFPVMYPVLVPGLIANPNHEQRNRGAGIYAVPVLPFTGSVAGIPSNTLIPLTYSIPTYQTGALAPFVRWVSQAMHRAAAPPRPPRLVARAEANVQPEDENVAAAEGLGAENDNRTQDDANGVAENDGAGEAGANGGNGWWRMVKEVQMIVFGFITSLLPGFHNVDHA